MKNTIAIAVITLVTNASAIQMSNIDHAAPIGYIMMQEDPAPAKEEAPAEKPKAPVKHLSPAMEAAIAAAEMVQVNSDIQYDDDESTYLMLNTNNRMMAATAQRLHWEDLALTGTSIDLDDGEEDLDENGEMEQADLDSYHSK